LRRRIITALPTRKEVLLPELILREEFHLGVFVPENGDEPDDDDDPIERVLDSLAFQTQLLQAIRQVFQHQPALANVVVRLSR
jgi:hypothetical protein